jgi:hypothetical protein
MRSTSAMARSSRLEIPRILAPPSGRGLQLFATGASDCARFPGVHIDQRRRRYAFPEIPRIFTISPASALKMPTLICWPPEEIPRILLPTPPLFCGGRVTRFA